MKRFCFHICRFFVFLLVLVTGTPARGQWIERAPMPVPRYAASAVLLGDWIYLIGGKNSGGFVKEVDRYNPEQDLWLRDVAPLDEGRANAAAVVYKGKIYLIGGESPDKAAVDDVFVYDPVKNRWEEFESLVEYRNSPAAVVYQNQLLVLGGSDRSGNYLRSAEVYDPHKKEWKVLPELSLPIQRASFGMFVHRGELFVVGGIFYGPVGSIEHYVPGQGWVARDSLLYPRGDFAMAVAGNYLYVIGGEGFTGPLGNMEIWDLNSMSRVKEDFWFPVRKSVAAVGYEGGVYVFGGYLPENRIALNLTQYYSYTLDVDAGDPTVPQTVPLVRAYPNPSHGKVRFQFLRNSPLKGGKITIFDLHGRVIWQSIIRPGQGEIFWDGKSRIGDPVHSGTYFFRVADGREIQTGKIVILR